MKLLGLAVGLGLASTSMLGGSAWAQTASSPSAPSATPAPQPEPPSSAAPPPPPSPNVTAVIAPPPVVRAAASTTMVDITTLAALRDRGTITQAEYDAAMKDMGNTTGEKVAGDAPTLVVGKWSTTLYGFAEADFIHDTTQSFNDLAGNAQVQRPTLTTAQQGDDLNTYAGNHGRTQFGVRNSRIGLRIRAPEVSGVRASGLLEMDFLGSTPSLNSSASTSNTYTSGSASEATFFTSPAFRVRHAMLRIETPIVDVLLGQYWDLFGWQGVYQPNSVQIQGLPGELYSRTPQLRLSKTLANDNVSLEIAVAAVRPPSRDSQVPEGQGGLRLALPFWKGVVTNAATATSVMPFSIAVTGDYRHFSVPEMSLIPQNDIGLDTYAAAVDLFIPVIPAKHVEDGNALSITGEAVTGSGMADLYTGLTGGVTFPVVANTTPINPGPTYPQDVDNGLVDFCPIAKGTPATCTGNPGSLVGIKWQTLIVGVQYYLPGVGGHVWISGNFSYQHSPNSADFARPTPATSPQANYYGSVAYQVRDSEMFADGNVFWQIVPAARLGAEYAYYNDLYVDGVHAKNSRFQLSGWFIF
jgi:hypothetical protein